MSETPTPAPALTDEQIDIVADALRYHPMLLGYGESDRLLISGALAIAAVRALDLPAVIARAKREERERIGRELHRLATERAATHNEPFVDGIEFAGLAVDLDDYS